MAKSLMADDRYSRGQRPGENFRREAPPADQKGDPLAELARLIGSSDPFGDPLRPKAAPPAPRIADPSTWHDEPRRDEPRREEPRREEPRREVARYEDRDGDYDAPPPRETRFRIEDDYDAPHEPRHVPGFDDDGGEPEALDTWRPNDPYQQTDGMFPREPQVFADPEAIADPQPAPPLRYGAAQPAPGYSGRTYEPPTGYEPRPEPRWVPPRPTGGAPVFDPDDPLGYERDARAAVPPAAHARHDEAVPPVPQWPEAAPGVHALHPDAYLRQHSDDFPPQRGYAGGPRGGGDGAERFGDRRADADDDGGDDRYSADDLAAHYATKAVKRPPPPRRPRAALIAAAAFGLAVIGAAGAFGYRLMSSGDSAKPAPVIRADGTPNKVMSAGTGDSGKQIQDRLADKGSGERVVSREEQPVEIRDASRPPTPRMVFPSQTAGAAQSNTAAVPAPPPSFAPAATTGGEPPKRIRTVTVRSDQGTATPSAPRPSAAPIVPPPAARADANAPLPINPGAAAAAAANTRTAAVAPAAPTLAAAASSGGYVVQISAQKTEAEAQSSFRIMQGRYPTQLGGRSPIIRRKDTASGTMYGTQVGPFASREDAIQLCEGLKSAGGSCFVQRN